VRKPILIAVKKLMENVILDGLSVGNIPVRLSCSIGSLSFSVNVF